MLKQIFTYTVLVLVITACSKQKPAETQNTASTATPQTASITMPTPQNEPQVASTPQTNESVASQPMQSLQPTHTPTATPDTVKNSNPKQPTKAVQEPKPVASTTPVITAEQAVSNSNEKPAENLPLKADLAVLFKTINDIDTKHQAKQAELEQQMQSAQTPEEQKKVFDEIVKQLDVQKQTITALKFNDKRVDQVRDKMLKNIEETRKGMAIMAKNPEATPQTHPEISKTMQQADKTASEVRENIQKLVAEADLDPTTVQ